MIARISSRSTSVSPAACCSRSRRWRRGSVDEPLEALGNGLKLPPWESPTGQPSRATLPTLDSVVLASTTPAPPSSPATGRMGSHHEVELPPVSRPAPPSRSSAHGRNLTVRVLAGIALGIHGWRHCGLRGARDEASRRHVRQPGPDGDRADHLPHHHAGCRPRGRSEARRPGGPQGLRLLRSRHHIRAGHRPGRDERGPPGRGDRCHAGRGRGRVAVHDSGRGSHVRGLRHPHRSVQRGRRLRAGRDPAGGVLLPFCSGWHSPPSAAPADP